jgi:hypothetical protein
MNYDQQISHHPTNLLSQSKIRGLSPCRLDLPISWGGGVSYSSPVYLDVEFIEEPQEFLSSELQVVVGNYCIGYPKR